MSAEMVVFEGTQYYVIGTGYTPTLDSNGFDLVPALLLAPVENGRFRAKEKTICVAVNDPSLWMYCITIDYRISEWSRGIKGGEEQADNQD